MIYLLLKLGGSKLSSISNLVGTVTLLGLNYFAYKGILAEAETHRDANKLAGGMYLDLMGLVWLIQFGTALVSTKFYYLLLLIPGVGAWKLYMTFH